MFAILAECKVCADEIAALIRSANTAVQVAIKWTLALAKRRQVFAFRSDFIFVVPCNKTLRFA